MGFTCVPRKVPLGVPKGFHVVPLSFPLYCEYRCKEIYIYIYIYIHTGVRINIRVCIYIYIYVVYRDFIPAVS